MKGITVDKVQYTSFVDSVKFMHEGSIFLCDSAVMVKRDNSLEAFGNVKIDDGDSIIITSQTLIYDGNTRKARLRNNVVFKKKGLMTLYTNNLNYDRDLEIATYFNNGRLVDSTNTLVSEKGYYHSKQNMASFKTDVIATGEDATMYSDTLRYQTETKVVYFMGPTKLVDSENQTFNYQSGTYDTRGGNSNFSSGAVESESYFLKGNEYQLYENEGYYIVNDNVELLAKEDDVIVNGDKSIHWKEEAKTIIFENAMMRIITDPDTLYVTADTLISLDSDVDSLKRILAYSSVRLYHNDFQGRADSLSFQISDSLIYFYKDPVLWTAGNQMSGDTINIEIGNKGIKQLNIDINAYVISKDTLGNFNQIKGRNMLAEFKDEGLDRVYVNGNGESIFFTLTEDQLGLMGMNKIVCSDITLLFEDSELVDVIFYTNSDGLFIPPHELKASERRLSGFQWREEEKPLRSEFTKTPQKTTPQNPVGPEKF